MDLQSILHKHAVWCRGEPGESYAETTITLRLVRDRRTGATMPVLALGDHDLFVSVRDQLRGLSTFLAAIMDRSLVARPRDDVLNCPRCLRRPALHEGPYPAIYCESCYDGTPDSATRGDIGAGRDTDEAIARWNEMAEDLAERIAEHGAGR